MLRPAVFARVKKAGQSFRLRVNAGNVRTFVQVAVVASERQIAQHGWTAMLPRNDVVDMQRERIAGLRHPAILARAMRSLPSLPLKGCIHVRTQASAAFLSESRAFDCISDRKFPTRA